MDTLHDNLVSSETSTNTTSALSPAAGDGSSALDTLPYFVVFYLIVTALIRDVIPKPQLVAKSVDPWVFHKYVDIVLGFIHANMSLLFAAIAVVHSGFNFGQPNYFYANLTLAHSFGYFATETIYSYFTDTMDGKTLFHHVCVLTAFVMTVLSNVSGTEICWAILASECSNPFMMIRNFLALLQKKGSVLHLVSSGIFVFLFCVARSYPGWILVYYTWEASTTPIAIKLAASSLLVVSHYWMLTMFRKVCKLVSGCKKDSLPEPGFNTKNVFWQLSLAGKTVQSNATLRTIFLSFLVYINIIYFYLETGSAIPLLTPLFAH